MEPGHTEPAGRRGYEFTDKELTGFSLTHISGPGCSAFGDVPILPTTGPVGTAPGKATAPFSHADEVARAGYYRVDAGGVRTELTATPRSGMARFTFPAGDASNLLFKLSDSAAGTDATRVRIVGDREVTGSVSSGHFCGADDHYTVHFDITFDQPFTAYGTWTDAKVDAHDRTASHTPSSSESTRTQPMPSPSASPSAGGRRHPAPRYHGKAPDGKTPERAKMSPVSGADGAYVTFDTTASQTVRAKVGVSFTSDANAALNREREIPGWDFDGVRAAAHRSWQDILGRVRIGGGDPRAQRIFYTALYHALLHPNVFSDVNREYMGFDDQVHKAAKGHLEYANVSGWDIYRTQVQLAATVAPRQTSDAVRSMLDQYDQTGMLPKWALANGESYVMVGDPAAPIIADAYAFGARDFDHQHALDALVAEATEPNHVRPGLTRYENRGYLPSDVTYGCCNFYGPVSTQLEYDTADYAVASYAKALGDADTATRLANRAQNWQNTFNPGTGLVQPKDLAGRFSSGFTPSMSDGMVEGTAAQYTPMVPFDVAGMATAAGGRGAWEKRLDGLLRNLGSPTGENADLSNEPSFEIPWEYDYVGAPYKTQGTVRQVQQQIYSDQPAGMAGNDDLGTMSSWYVWSALGMYPETPGTADLALGSPLFPHAAVTLPTGKTLTVDAPAAAQDAPYVQNMTLNGKRWPHAYLRPGLFRTGGTLHVGLGGTPNTAWGTRPADAPPSYQGGLYPALGYLADDSQVVVEPGKSATVTLGVRGPRGKRQEIRWKSTADDGVGAGPSSGTVVVPANGDGKQQVRIAVPAKEGRYQVVFHLTAPGGVTLPKVVLQVAVANPGELWPYYNNVGTAQDGKAGDGNYDGVGWAYSAQALAAAGVKPGASVQADGLTYTWPDVATGEADNIVAGGQRIPVTAPAGASAIGFVGSVTNANPGGTGDVTVTYTDGSTSTVSLGFGDWTLAAGTVPVPYGNTTVAKVPYRNTTSGDRDDVTTYVFAAHAGIEAGKTVASVTLPASASQGQLHVFAFAFGTPSG